MATLTDAQTALAAVPDPAYISSADPSVLLTSFIAGFQAGYNAATGSNIALGLADGRRYMLQYIAQQCVQERINAELERKQTYLKYATGPNLDLKGADYGPRGARLQGAPALTTLQFSVAVAAPNPIIIPAGSQVSAIVSGASVSFATTADCTIAIGGTSASASAACLTLGTRANGLVPGSINILQTLGIGFVVTAQNTVTSYGGADVESDDRYRYRLWLVTESFSTCGTTFGYIFWTLTANAGVIDVGVYSDIPNAGKVFIVPLMAGGIFPTPAELTAILTFLSADDKRPLTDQVIVQAPIAQTYSIAITYYLLTSQRPTANSLGTAIAAAVAKFASDTGMKLGIDINPSQLTSVVEIAGAKRSVITSPVFTAVPWNYLAQCSGITVVFGGFEDA